MRILDGEQTLVRIFIGESGQHHHQPLHRALLERLRREGFAGATVFRAMAGFGANSIIHTTSLVDLSADLPMVIEVVDDDRHIALLLSILDEMLLGGALVTLERARVLHYAAARDPKSASDPITGPSR